MKTIISRIQIFTILFTILTISAFSQTTLHCLEFFGSDIGVTIGNGGEIFKTIDAGKTWAQVNSNVSANLNKTSVFGDNQLVIVGDNGTILKSIDGGTTFSTIVTSAQNPLANANLYGVALNSAGIGFAVGENGIIIKTTDSGDSWNTLQNNRGVDLNAVSLFGTDNGIIVGRNNSIQFTVDGGETWGPPGTSLPFQVDFRFVRMIDKATAYATTTKGHIIKTTDAGNSWQVVYHDEFDATYYRVNITDAGMLVAVGDNGSVKLSADEGATWISGHSNSTQNLYCLNFVDASIGFAGGQGGILLKTEDGGMTWSDVSSLLVQNPAVNLVSKSKNKSIILNQNFPNPFNPSTVISYEIPFDANVSVKIYDMLGKEVADLTSAFQKAGSYSVQFNASNLSSGIYFYKLQAVYGINKLESVKKMILAK